MAITKDGILVFSSAPRGVASFGLGRVNAHALRMGTAEPAAQPKA
jgi:hypothetical protein